MRALAPAAAATAALALALAAVGCGLGAGKAPSAVGLLVTREFGARVVRSWGAPNERGQETAMSLLARNATVSTRFGGGFVQSIDGLAGGRSGGNPVDWFYYVNGIEASKGAASTNVHAGDHIWWDWHDWSATDDIPAVVGSFPQPFLNGIAGKRLPVRVECASVRGYACKTVTARLRAQKVPAARSPASQTCANCAPARARVVSTRRSPPPARRSRCSTRARTWLRRSPPAPA
jgi:hypothetical protein